MVMVAAWVARQRKVEHRIACAASLRFFIQHLLKGIERVPKRESNFPAACNRQRENRSRMKRCYKQRLMQSNSYQEMNQVLDITPRILVFQNLLFFLAECPT